jgi:hypothetical protein
MALLGNMDVFDKNPARGVGGQSLACNRPNSNRNGSQRNMYSAEFNYSFNQKNGIAVGYVPPYCYKIAMKSGGMATFKFVTGSGAVVSANLAGGLNASTTSGGVAGTGDITNAQGALIVSAVAALTGSVTLTASMIGKLEAVAALTGSGDLTGALGALASLLASLSGSGTLTADTVAKAFMSAAINVTGDVLTTANVADAIWNALAASYNTAGTMGNKLNSAASAGDPWSTALPGSYAAGSAGYILGTMSGASYAQAQLILKILRNKTATDPATGIMTVYDDDGVTPLFTANIYQDVAATTPYDGNGINLKDRLT